jgi:hypothetical protein
VADEATAECHAIQLADEAGAALGVDERYVAQLKSAYWEAYPSLPAEYRSDECRRGGALDLGGGDTFP